MTRDEYVTCLSADSPPSGLKPALAGLWHAHREDWDAAHKAVQDHETDCDCAWVHAFLHRWEGDQANAEYWYRRAGRTVSRADRDAEWRQIVDALVQ